MKIYCSLLIALALGCAGIRGYQTLGTIETTANSSYQTYNQLVISGKLSTNGLPNVARAYAAFQAAMIRAIIYAQNNTNAPASPEALQAADVLAQKIATETASK